ncbi:MAG TPA: low temperature requirement protein A [Solirubrobacterales bacterium]
MEDGGGASGTAAERRTTPVELLWDLAFVYAVTQVTALLVHHLSWAGFGKAMLILALVWWAWSAFVWAANAQAEDSATMELALLASLVLIFVAGLAVPGAFGSEATLFALTYAGVRMIHLGLYVDASRRGNASWEAIAGFGAATIGAMGLLVAGSLLGGSAQVVLWIVAVAVDYAGPAWLTRERLRGLQRVAVAHFAERYGLFVIICLGESIVAIGLAANGHHVGAELIAAVACGLLVTIGLWRTYFGELAVNAERSLHRDDADVVLAAADGYSYLHLLIVAGIAVFAVGVKVAVEAPGHTLGTAARLALCGGVALYLVGHAAFRLRMVARANPAELAAVAAALLVFAAGAGLAAWLVIAVLAAVVLALCGAEAVAGSAQGQPRS